MKTVATFTNQEESLVAQSYLASFDIDSLLGHDHIASTIPHITHNQGFPLLVSDDDFEIAQQKLADVVEPSALAEYVEAPDIPWTAIAIVVGLIIVAATIRNLL